MEIQFLGTAAAEGIPALWCDCERCRKSRKVGGRALRTRSQALIDGTLLIDFPADTYAHILQNGIDLLNVTDCIVTHTHSDHLYPTDIAMLKKGFSHVSEGFHLTFHGSAKVGERVSPQIAGQLEKEGTCSFHEVKAFEPFAAGKYTITPLTAIHDPNAGPLFYQISDGEKTMIYGHDTHFFHDDVWAYWEKTHPHFDLVSLDCTNACLPLNYVGHMGLAENVQVKEKMLELGLADDKTIFICNHFSHNGTHAAYDDFVPIAAKEGFGVSYDGMKVTF
ncbi:MAG: hypothetical protein IJ493_13575 [Clostridia bacterium]|nr:hypothetical protein [Clostridia bacterium]